MMCRNTGKALSEAAHIRQSVAEVLLTPRGSRVERREFGSDIFRLIDRPWSGTLKLQLMAATVLAISRWEPRVVVKSATVDDVSTDGRATMAIDLQTLSGQAVSLSVGLGG